MTELPKIRTNGLVNQYLEYTAIKKFLAEGRDDVMEENYPEVAANMDAALNEIASFGHEHLVNSLLNKIIRGELSDIGDVYEAIRLSGHTEDDFDIVSLVVDDVKFAGGNDDDVIPATSEPFIRSNKNEEIKVVKRGRQKQSRELFQRKKQGEAFIEDVELVSYAKASVTKLSMSTEATEDDVRSLAPEITGTFPDVKLSPEQYNTLINEIMLPQYRKLTQHDRTDRLFLDMGNNDGKSLFYLWHQIKRRCAVGDDLAISQADGRKWAGCSPGKLVGYIKSLADHGAIGDIRWGQKSTSNRIATVIKRLL